ncbi:MAG TPA: 4Fe-4S dicluster domain-containing protein [Phycisphaerae bacterium]|nr:4Fe-4S dicluster domain-containing protein [Phycisphaerae bacterium]
MSPRRYGSFAGGIDLPDEKLGTLDEPIRAPVRLERLRIPLPGRSLAEVRLSVRPGQYVSAGQLLASPAGAGGLAVHAPYAGKAGGLCVVQTAGSDGFAPSAALELLEPADPPALHALSPVFDWRAADRATLLARIAEGAVPLHDGRGGSLSRFVERAQQANCHTLVANALESQPYLTADHRLLVEHGADVIRGLAILARAIGAREVILAADRRRTGEYRELVGPARMYQIARVALPHKYPVGAANVLVKVLTGREVPPGGSALGLGVAVVDPATCFAAYRWTACGVAPSARVVTLAGERLKIRGNFWVPVGASVAELTGGTDGPVLHGGPMTGLRCPPDAVVTAATGALLAINAAQAAPSTPCIRCGWCTDHCPARLNVAVLNDVFELGLVQRARRMGVAACVECGVCSYVCPSRLPLSQRVRQLRRAVTDLNDAMPLFAES